MDTKEILLGSSLVIALSIIVRFIYFNGWSELIKQDMDLAVCILSARNNFNFRDAIRQSWLTDIQSKDKKNSAIAKFVVGKMDCLIHPKNRLSSHECHRWEPKLPEKITEITAFSLISRKEKTGCQIVLLCYVKVMHDVILKSLGIAEIFPFDSLAVNDSVHVVLYDSVTEEEVSSVYFTHKEGIDSNGFLYKSVQELHLPKGYEFTLVAVLPSRMTWRQCPTRESTGSQMSEEVKSWETVQSHHQLVIVELLDDDDTVLNTDTGKAFLAAASFMFSVHDILSLEHHVATISQRDLEWQEEMSTVAAQLQEEEAAHGDTIMVNVVDVYRNLPQKLLLCHAWFHERFNPAFVLKTDDDCFVNLATILEILPEQDTGRGLWWGNFRRNWAVDRHGKWREPNFSSSVYPKFACGSGYVVSNRIHSWFIQNQDILQKFQGEDVSTGIWISGLDVSYIQDDRWQCAMSCQNDALSLPELNASMVWWHWNNSKNCASPCSVC